MKQIRGAHRRNIGGTERSIDRRLVSKLVSKWGELFTFFKGKTEDSKFLSGDRVEHALDHFVGESSLLVIVHGYYLVPVRRGNVGGIEVFEGC